MPLQTAAAALGTLLLLALRGNAGEFHETGNTGNYGAFTVGGIKSLRSVSLRAENFAGDENTLSSNSL